MSVRSLLGVLPAVLVLACGPAGPAPADRGGAPDAPGDTSDLPADLASDVPSDPAARPDPGTDIPALPTDVPADPVADAPDDSPADVPLDAPGDLPVDAALDLPADLAADLPADPGPPPFPPPAPAGCVTDVSAGEHRFPCNGLVHDLSVPEACLTAPCGVVVDLHGLTMSAAMQDRNTDLRALGRQHGYIVLQPSANPSPPASSWKTGEDDARVLAFLSDVEAAFHPDAARIHATGFSQGGLMAWRFLCKHPERFASMAIGSSCSYPTQEACSFSGAQVPPRRIPLLYMHGEDDIIYLFNAAEAQRDAVILAWGLREDATLSKDALHLWKRWVGDGGEVFEFLRHAYNAKSDVLKGHCYPGSTDPGGMPGQLFSFACQDAAAFAWGRIALDFFRAHPRPAP